MKVLKFFWLVCVLVGLFSSCQSDYTQNKTILKAEKLMYTCPDSAYTLLLSIRHPEKLSKADYAAWCLHYTFAQDKLHKKITSDSLIKIAIDYYSTGNLPKYTGMGWYLLGCIHSSHNEKQEAIFAFNKAEEILKGTSENRLKRLVAFNLGYTSMQDELYRHSLGYFREALGFFKKAGDGKNVAYAYREISNMYYQLDYPSDSVSRYLDLSAKLSKKAGDSINYYSVLIRRGQLLLGKNDYCAKELLLKAYKHFPESKCYNAAYLARAYSGLNRQDSALYYLDISLADTINTPYRIIGLHAAVSIFKSKGDYKKALYYLEKAHALRDSTYQQNIRSQLYIIDKQYDLNQKEEENARLKIDRRNMAIGIALLVIAGLISCLAFLLINAQHKQRHNADMLENQRLEHEAERTTMNNAQKKELLGIRIQNKIDNTLQFKKLKKNSLQPEKMESFIQEVAKQSIIAEKEWPDYVKEVDSIFEAKITTLRNEYRELTMNDLIVIALIGLKVDISKSCSLLDMNVNTMYVRRKTIKMRLGIQEGVHLEQWISDYLSKEKG